VRKSIETAIVVSARWEIGPSLIIEDTAHRLQAVVDPDDGSVEMGVNGCYNSSDDVVEIDSLAFHTIEKLARSIVFRYDGHLLRATCEGVDLVEGLEDMRL